MGDTDSEATFCAILNALRNEFSNLPTLPVLHRFLKKLCEEIGRGDNSSSDTIIFNFLLGCGQYTLFAYSWPGSRPGSNVWNGLHYLIREAPFSKANLIDCDYSMDLAQHNTIPGDRIAVITTKPLTDETGWKEFQRGELLMFDKGKPYSDPDMCASVEQQGRGLFSKSIKKMNLDDRCRNPLSYLQSDFLSCDLPTR